MSSKEPPFVNPEPLPLQSSSVPAKGAASAPALLEVRDLRVEYLTPKGSVKAVDGVSFSIGQGEVFGLAGESGSGKSTIALALLRVLRPPAIISGGEVFFKGKNVLELAEGGLEEFRWQDVSMVFQSAMNSLNPVMKVGDQIADVLIKHKGISQKAAKARALE